MMNGSVPEARPCRRRPALALSLGGLVGDDSPGRRSRSTSLPPSHHTHFFRSLHGFPSGSAEARLYRRRRLAGQAQPHFSWAPGLPGGSGVRLSARFLSGAGIDPRVDPRGAGRRAVVLQIARSRRVALGSSVK